MSTNTKSQNTNQRFPVIILIFFSLLCSCTKIDPQRVVKIKTGSVTNINYTSCSVAGNILDRGLGGIKSFGFSCSISQNPTIANTNALISVSTLNSSDGFSGNISGLEANTTYYVRAFIRNYDGDFYGEQQSFTTLAYNKPTVTTTDVTTFTSTSATIGGNVTADGNTTVTHRGVFWGTSQNPQTTGNTLEIGSGTGVFSTNLSGLSPNTTYYVKAFATNSQGSAYGSQISFKTSLDVTTPTVTTTDVTTFTSTSATVGGNVTSDGNATVTDRGVYWGTSQNPETTGTKLQIGSGTGVFSTSLSGLSPNTTYYVKAFATNNQGSAYGSQISFKTSLDVTIPTVTTTDVTTFTSTSATVGGNVTSDGNATVTDRGVYWGTSQNPETTGTKLQIGSGTGVFSTGLSGLTSNTTYYVKAYAINSQGTAYGVQISFTTTLDITIPTITTTDVTTFASTSALVGGNVTSDGNATVADRGIYYGTSQNPELTGNKLQIGSGTGNFSIGLSGLTPNTTYFVKAYAINSQGAGYGEQQSFTTDPTTIIDASGNSYNVIRIGNQLWMRENLKTTKYNDGTIVPLKVNDSEWINLTTSGYCWYNYDEVTYKDTYGALYNWYAVNTGKLCPAGWHVPTGNNWSILITYLGGYALAGGKLKESGTSHWWSPNTGATNETNFTALPGAGHNIDGQFSALGNYGCWWSTTEYSTTEALYRIMQWDSESVLESYINKGVGWSVRCIRD